MIKTSIAALIAIMISGCSANYSCEGTSIKWFWQDNNFTVSDCNESKKDPYDVEDFKKFSKSIDEHRENTLSECKKSGFSGYAESKNDLICSNGETKDGCVVTSTGFMCGDVTFVKFSDENKSQH